MPIGVLEVFVTGLMFPIRLGAVRRRVEELALNAEPALVCWKVLVGAVMEEPLEQLHVQTYSRAGFGGIWVGNDTRGENDEWQQRC